jgi:hypothetical protein
MAHGPQRREPRRFEPPPWEREQFEQLERERKGREQRAREAAEAARPAPAQAPPSPPTTVDVAGAQPVQEPASAPQGSPEGADPVRVDAMLVALKAEEPPAVQGAWKFGLVAAAFVGTVGLMLVVWGMVALARSAGSGPAGVMGATIMSVMGGLFVGLAAWMGARSLKQRGVL